MYRINAILQQSHASVIVAEISIILTIVRKKFLATIGRFISEGEVACAFDAQSKRKKFS